jgi:saccharopine dehydrogenase-like NADP-dependent oxidoreductase
MRAIGIGWKDGRETKVTVDLIDGYDPTTGFTGMERLTGWHCAIMMGFQASGKIDSGAHRRESAVPAADVMEAVKQRGIHFEIKFE